MHGIRASAKALLYKAFLVLKNRGEKFEQVSCAFSFFCKNEDGASQAGSPCLGSQLNQQKE